jgi:hypothetical protein
MQPETQAKLQKIKRISTRLLVVCKVLFVLIGLQFVAEAVMILAGRDGALGYYAGSISITGLSLSFRLMLLAACVVTSAVMAKFVLHLQRLFTSYSHGDIFTREAVGQLLQLGITYLLWFGVAIIWMLLRRAIAGQTMHSYHVPSESLSIGIILMSVAWFMEMAVEIREENELTI